MQNVSFRYDAQGLWVLRDLTGAYTLALMCSFVLSMMGMLSILVLPSTAHQQIPAWEKALPPEVRATT